MPHLFLGNLPALWGCSRSPPRWATPGEDTEIQEKDKLHKAHRMVDFLGPCKKVVDPGKFQFPLCFLFWGKRGTPTKLLLVIYINIYINRGSLWDPYKWPKIKWVSLGVIIYTSISGVIIILLVTGRGPSLYGHLDFFCVFFPCVKNWGGKKDRFRMLFVGAISRDEQTKCRSITRKHFSSAPCMLVQLLSGKLI